MNIESFCIDLDAYLKREFAYKRKITERGLGRTIVARIKAFWLYFRYPTDDSFGKETLVIAGFFFREKRKGHGTRGPVEEPPKMTILVFTGSICREKSLLITKYRLNPLGFYSPPLAA